MLKGIWSEPLRKYLYQWCRQGRASGHALSPPGVGAGSVKGPMWARPVHQAEASEFRSGAAPRLGLVGTQPCMIVRSRGLAG